MADWIIGGIIALLFLTVVIRGIYHMRHPEKKKSSCCGGCQGDGGCSGCHEHHN